MVEETEPTANGTLSNAEASGSQSPDASVRENGVGLANGSVQILEEISELRSSLKKRSWEFYEAVHSDDRWKVSKTEALGSESVAGLKLKTSEALRNALQSRRSLGKKLKTNKGHGDVEKLVGNFDGVIKKLRSNVKDLIEDIQDSLDKYARPEVAYQKGDVLEPSESSVQSICSYAHKLCYTTFAPLGYDMSQPLRLFKPPAPQEQQLRDSALYAFAEKRGLAKAEEKPAAVGVKSEPMGAVPPTNWKPNNPIPAEGATPAIQAPVIKKEKEETEEDSGEGTSGEGDEQGGVGFDFILNPDLEVVEEEDESSEGSSDEDDGDDDDF